MSATNRGASRNARDIHARVTEDEYERISVLARERGTSVSDVVRSLVVGAGAEATEPRATVAGRTGRRDERVEVRLTNDELGELRRNASRARMGVGAYVRARCIYSDIPLVDVDDSTLSALVRELAHEGNNLNQVAHHLNAAQDPDAELACERDAVYAATENVTSLALKAARLLRVPRD